MYLFILSMYRQHALTAHQVWAQSDKGVITAEQALQICGPRPMLNN